MYVPNKLETNKCFSIGEMFKNDATKFKMSEKVVSVLTRAAKNPLFDDPDEKDEFKPRAGLALIEATPGFKYKCAKDNDLIDLVLGRENGILLTWDCCLQFVPKDPEELPRSIMFKAHIFDGSNDKVASKALFKLSEIESNNGFSLAHMTANVLRESCEGILGQECAKVIKCPDGEVMDSKGFFTY